MYVDLGLPSGNLWSRFNLGAKKEEELGLYYQWGGIEGYTKDFLLDTDKTKSLASWDNYPYSKGTGISANDANLTKYCINSDFGYEGFIDNKTQLELCDDIANILTNECIIPTKDDYLELIENTEAIEGTKFGGWINDYKGTPGVLRKSKINDNYIFFPASFQAGNNGLSINNAKYSSLWTSTQNPDNAVYGMVICFSSGWTFQITSHSKWILMNIRPIKKNNI